MILAASLKLIGREGWEGLTFQRIASVCGMAPSNVVYHFSSRETLLEALLDEVSRDNYTLVARAMRPEFNAFQRLVVHITKNIEWARRSPEQAQVVLQIFARANHGKRYGKIFADMVEKGQERIREHLLAGQRERLFHFPEDSTLVARAIHNLMIGAFFNVMGNRKNPENAYPDAEWKLLLSKLLDIRMKKLRIDRN